MQITSKEFKKLQPKELLKYDENKCLRKDNCPEM